MLFSSYGFALWAAAFINFSNVAAVAPTDEYTDADPGQSSYLPNHNMDPAVVDSSQFGQLWKIPFNAMEQVSDSVLPLVVFKKHLLVPCFSLCRLVFFPWTDQTCSFTQNH